MLVSGLAAKRRWLELVLAGLGPAGLATKQPGWAQAGTPPPPFFLLLQLACSLPLGQPADGGISLRGCWSRRRTAGWRRSRTRPELVRRRGAEAEQAIGAQPAERGAAYRAEAGAGGRPEPGRRTGAMAAGVGTEPSNGGWHGCCRLGSVQAAGDAEEAWRSREGGWCRHEAEGPESERSGGGRSRYEAEAIPEPVTRRRRQVPRRTRRGGSRLGGRAARRKGDGRRRDAGIGQDAPGERRAKAEPDATGSSGGRDRKSVV